MSSRTPQLVSFPDEGLDIYSRLDLNSTEKWTTSILVCGMQKGIQFYKNSCYVDATLMLLFYTHDHVDLELEQTSPLYQHLVPIINSIRSEPFYCQEGLTTRFRNCIEGYSLLGKIGIGDLMDAEEFIRKIFPRIFKRGFIYYQGNVPNFVHCVINYNTGKNDADFLSNIFQTSMSKQGLHFRTLPHPMLLIKSPYSGGKLQGYDYVIPDLVMRVYSGANKDHSALYELTGVMSYRGSHFVAYMRRRTNRGNKWLYYNSTSHNDISQVVSCDSLEKSLIRVMEDPSRFFLLRKSDLALADLCKTSFIAFYAPTSSQKRSSNCTSRVDLITTEREASSSNGPSASALLVTPMAQVHTPGVYESATITSAKASKPPKELDVGIANAGSTINFGTTNKVEPCKETNESVTRDAMQVFSMAIYAFTDRGSPLYRWIEAHTCIDCHNASSLCLPAVVLSYRKNIQDGKYKNMYDILNCPSMASSRIKPNMLGDASRIFNLLLHACNAPQFLQMDSGNIYQMDLPVPEETRLMSMASKLLLRKVIVRHSLIVTRVNGQKGGIIPSEEIYLNSNKFKLYGVMCKSGEEYCLYTIQPDSSFTWRQSWYKISCNTHPGETPWRIDKFDTEAIAYWARNVPQSDQTTMMFHSKVWIYSPSQKN